MEERFRTQSAMVLMAFERSVGDIIKNNVHKISDLPNGIVKKITDRNKGLSSIDDVSVEQLINCAYLDEIIEMSTSASSLQHLSSFFSEVKDLASTLDIYNIRNKFAHPNYPFLETYWHKVAAFATDPFISSLKLYKVFEAFQKAQAGTLDEIPDEWLQTNLFEIINNLPSQFSHHVTGLLGRKKEVSELKKRLLGVRYPLVAIVAPGGVGKTALILEVLHHISQLPDASAKFDRICYFSAKRQALTLDGPKQLNSIQTFSQLAYEISVETGQEPEQILPFPHEELFKLESDESVLLCIDNVETFLIDDINAFREFYEMLPESWKVVVTSRIPIDAASTLLLEDLDANDGKILARSYARSRAIRIDEPQILDIPETILINPLAVRLVIDGFGRGKPISDVVSTTASHILEFSYSNLLDTLDDSAVLVLEALLAKPDADRVILEQLTGLQEDSVAESLNQLSRTSLLRQQSDAQGVIYFIADGVRDLILTNERNFQAREAVAHRLQELDAHATQAVLNQTARGINEYHWAFLPPTASDYTIQKLSRIWPKILASKHIKDMAEIKRELDAIGKLVEESEILHAYYSYLHMKMKDYGRAAEYIKKAIEISNDLPRYRIVFSTVLWHQQQYDEQISICRDLINEIGVDPAIVGESTVRLLLTGYFLPHIWMGKYQEVITETEHWRKSENRNMLGTFRASAIKRASEHMRDEEAMTELGRCAVILDEVIRDVGYETTVCKVTAKVIDDFAYRARSIVDNISMLKSTSRMLEFCDCHLVGSMKSVGREGDCRYIAEVFAALGAIDNPFRQHHWLVEISYEKAKVGNDSEDSEYVNVEVYHIPEAGKGDFPNYIFAQDTDGNQYFLLHTLVNVNSSKPWRQIQGGDTLQIIPDFEGREAGKAIPVIDILLH